MLLGFIVIDFNSAVLKILPHSPYRNCDKCSYEHLTKSLQNNVNSW